MFIGWALRAARHSSLLEGLMFSTEARVQRYLLHLLPITNIDAFTTTHVYDSLHDPRLALSLLSLSRAA